MEKIDITPEGAKTEEGRARISAAIKELDLATTACANLLGEVFQDMICGDSFKETWENIMGDVRIAVMRRSNASNNFLLALAGN